MKRSMLLLILCMFGCQAPEVQFMNRQADKFEVLSAKGGNVLRIQTNYTNPLMNAYTVKTGKEPKENVLAGAKDIAMGIVNVLGTITEPWVAGIPIAGYIGAAVVQKVGDTQFVTQTIEIPLDDIQEVDIVWETDAGRKDIKQLTIRKQ